MERYLDIDPLKHKEFLYHFYEGANPGSWSMGELYNYDEATRDARPSCSTTASLCGIERTIITHDKPLLETSVDRDLKDAPRHGSFLRGFPDAQLRRRNRPAQRLGLQRKTRIAWKTAAICTVVSSTGPRPLCARSPVRCRTSCGRGMEDLRAMRNDPCFAPDAWVSTWDTFNDSVLAVIRQHEGKTLVGLFNFSRPAQHAPPQRLQTAF